MLTSTDAADVLNLVETSAINSLEADPWLKTGGSGGIGLIHPWALRPDRTYQAHELPAISVRAAGIVTTNHVAPAGTEDLAVVLVIEAIEAAADRNAAAATAQRMAARLRRWLAEQNVPGGNRLDGLLDDGDGVVVPGAVSLLEEKKVEHVHRAVARVEATVKLRAGV